MTEPQDLARAIGLAHEEPQLPWAFTLVPKFVQNLWPKRKRGQSLASAESILKDMYRGPILEQLQLESVLLGDYDIKVEAGSLRPQDGDRDLHPRYEYRNLPE